MADVTISEALQRAGEHHQAGHLPAAATLYREILAHDPNCVGALHGYGILALQIGRHDVAAEVLRQAAALAPGDPAIHSNLGEAWRQLGRLDDAIGSYRRALSLQPEFHNALANLGLALSAQGKFDDAVICLRRVIALKPDFAEAFYNLGNVLDVRGQLDEAIGCFRQALALKPDFVEAMNHLGNAVLDQNRLEEAADCYRQAIALKPDLAEVHNNLGTVLLVQRRFVEAESCFRRALALKPDFTAAVNHLGNAMLGRDRLDEAADCYRQAIALRPDYAEAHANLGTVFSKRRQFDETVACFKQAITLKPDLEEGHNSLAAAFKERGQIDEALASYRRALALKPGRADIHSSLLFVMQYEYGRETAMFERELRHWNEQHALPLAKFIQPHGNERSPDRRLRVGFLSADLKSHAVALFLLPWLRSYDREQWHVTAYSNTARPDDITTRFQACSDAWCSLVGLSDEDAVQRIRDDRIDVLVDLSGHTAGNRLPVFARRPAPVQVSYLGYPASTGLETMDYRLSDGWADPPGTSTEFQSEQLLRLPDTAWCFAPLTDNPPASELPARRHGYVTFGCFNNFAKVSDYLLPLWVRLLQRVPGSRLALKNQAVTTPSVATRLREFFAGHAISSDRLELMPHAESAYAHLECYRRVDLALDTFPYHGTTTTCEALWMGVPVLTLAGDRHVSRVGVSLLTNVGLPEFVAQSPDAYVEAAVAAAGDLPRLAAARYALRERMQRSPLMDASRFARATETAFRTMWHRWCAQPASSHPNPESRTDRSPQQAPGRSPQADLQQPIMHRRRLDR
jgi:protein O-GlcNAc transferase